MIKRKLIPGNEPLKVLIFAGISFYLLLCILHFLSARPLWLDEVKVVDNLKELEPAQIFGPLKHNQGFPRVYLFLMQKTARAFDYNIYSLRAMPFLFMVLAFFVWLRIYGREEDRGVGYLLFILSWCGSHFMTYYAAEVKQYSGDVLVAALFTLFILSQGRHLKPAEQKAKRKVPRAEGEVKQGNASFSCLIGYIFLPSLILFSYTGYFFILIPIYNLALSLKDDRKNILPLCIYLASLAFFMVLSYNFDVKYTQSDEALRAYWKDYFISTSSFSGFVQSFTEGIRNLFVRWFIETKLIRRIMTVFLPFALYALFYHGIRRINKDRGAIFSLKTVTPVLVAGLFFAGLLKAYPFTGARITIYIAPFIFYILIKGIELSRGRIKPLYVGLISLYVATLLSTSFYLLYKYVSLL